ncbi:type II toxin-antitoxin system PemK/MazF family toxin [Protofrankia symbiont of Coriaria ruscifolia]|uniref:type II toxin-antitoxin system PemK/MazF family toxin n=1 Tax=Protofrankia symbiont of Coriaria ruscifolia TaxID=1306542 RepID=UPI0010412D00|nr:type II toxin-antitoxin system PemK/MazF family toxin [Protofrankia symbiont of Coriaria ruscifolia]
MSRLVRPGQVWFVDLGVPIGSEQAGRRPVVVVGSALHCSFPIGMALVTLCTSVDRELPHHVAIDWRAAGLDRPTWVRTEDMRSVSERRFAARGPLGRLTDTDLAQVRRFIRMMIDE